MLDIARERLHAQHLVKPLGSPAAVVQHLVAVQSQDFPGARWAVGQRVRGAKDDSVGKAYDAGEILRTHVLRPTWHFVVPADARWLLALTAPRVHAANAHYYRLHAFTAARFAKTDTALVKALDGEHLTRAELAERLALDESGPALSYVMMHAELEAAIISGPRRGKELTYARFDDRVPASKPLARDAALGELARRYVTSHGPATIADLAWWSGLTKTDARRALELAGLVAGDGYYRAAAKRRAALAEPTIHLLPNYDECLIAFADRTAMRDPRIEKVDPSVLAAHFVMSNGKVIGGFRRTTEARETVLACTLLVTPTRAEIAAIHEAAARFSAFLGTPVRVTIR